MAASGLAGLRPWVSPIVAVSFIAVAGTGVLMLAHFRGGGLRGVHETTGLLFAVAGILHLAINWRAFLACFRRPAALVFVAVVTALCVLLAVFSGRHGDRTRGGGRFRSDAFPSGYRR